MTVEQLIKGSADELVDAGYVHGEREASIFLAEILGVDTNTIYNRYEDEVDIAATEQMARAVQLRLKGQPLSYITGNQAFMGWKLKSDNRALIPRPETEQLCELLVREIQKRHLQNGQFLEIGTGAGPIAIALKKHCPQAEVTATDVSEEALELAEENAQMLKVEINFLQSDLFASVEKKKFDVIVANLPYVPTQKLNFVSDQILDWEPMVAIEAGEDGMKYITPFLEQAKEYLADNGIIAIEFWHTHGDPVRDIVEKELPNYEVEILKDLAGFDRFAIIKPN